jgi:predicted nucleic acid binding AN1-type Zn finger protein
MLHASSGKSLQARGRAALGAVTCSQEANDGLIIKSCASTDCRKGVFCAFTCKHCCHDFCDEHHSVVAHSCTAADTADRRAMTCSGCGALIIEYEVLACIDSTARAEYEALAQRVRLARDQVLGSIREKLSKTAKLSGNVYSFSATMATLDEDDAHNLASPELRANLQRLEHVKNTHLQALHETRCCSGNTARQTDASTAAAAAAGYKAPASHNTVRCNMKSCKKKCSSAFLQHCKKCDQHFCLPHRLPEVHACPAPRT